MAHSPFTQQLHNVSWLHGVDVTLLLCSLYILDIFCIQLYLTFTVSLLKIPNSIQERLSKNSSNEEIFNTARCEYEDALKKSGFKFDFKYTKNQLQKSIDLEILFGLTHHSTKQYPQILQKYFFD